MTDEEFELLIQESLARGLRRKKVNHRQSAWCDELGIYMGLFQMKEDLSPRARSVTCWAYKPTGRHWVPEVEGLPCPA